MTIRMGIAGLTAIVLAAGAASAETLAPGDVTFKDGAVESSLTGQPGDPEAGAKAFADRKLGNCLACHAVSQMSDQLFHGNVGPALDGVAARYSPETLRAIVTNSKEVFGEQTVMPGFYSLDVGIDVAEAFQGKTILSAQDVEDVVAFLGTLQE
ncbi:sulfur oxidation c-type cytochrome SoxX [Microbaculum marinisediminis]|uniref:Sulfur oxidation c-type cytochrome SoxX n=1 Tax=Microbaculum marinisediminis TaxID=2931392 RepID=A0AAW5R481_9HYPH|nr:sulfur oxidation c-type cytochrome SoxX [Microbaculum sp. A6E488]MCT8973340.1 sulfur oxidation c-type cytochrome SoxX [Microbaculum sp. A6E488]